MISVIIPVYNVERYIRQCLESVLSQTYRDLEILIIDDGSTDGCGGICDEYAAADSRVRVIHQPNEGVSAARNAGLGAATGEYIGFVDPDDWIEPQMFEVLLEKLVSADADMSICGYVYEYATRQKPVNGFGDGVLRGEELIRRFARKDFGNTLWNKLFRAECFGGIRFPDYRTFEDVAVFYKIIVAAQSVVTTSDLLYHYRKRIGSVTKTPSMENLRNHWAAYHARYECVVKLVADTPENASAKRWMSMEIASAAIRPFRWICGIPKKERDTELIRSVSEFLRHNFKATGDKGWSLNLRVSAFLARRPNALSCAVMYLASRVYVKKVRITEGRELYP